MGLDQRLHRRRQRQADLRLDHRRPHLRHLHASSTYGRSWRSVSCPKRSPPSPNPTRATGPIRPRAAGWAQPPKDYAKWAELLRQWALHAVARYGKAEVETWQWELWNEPDIFYWRGTPAEYDKLYDYTPAPCAAPCPRPRSAARRPPIPAPRQAGEYLRQFLEHCAKTNAPLDFISFHAKGSPRMVDGHLRMGVRQNLLAVQKGVEIVNQFPQYQESADRAERVRPRGLRAPARSRAIRRWVTATAPSIPLTPPPC